MERRHDESVSSHVRMVAGELGRLFDQLEVEILEAERRRIHKVRIRRRPATPAEATA